MASPNSSVMRPAITLPRGREKSIEPIVWASLTTTGVPGSYGRFCPYCKVTYPALLTLTVYRPRGSSTNSYRPSPSVVVARRTCSSAARSITCARRSGSPACDRTRPRSLAVPVCCGFPVVSRGTPGTCAPGGAPGRAPCGGTGGPCASVEDEHTNARIATRGNRFMTPSEGSGRTRNRSSLDGIRPGGSVDSNPAEAKVLDLEELLDAVLGPLAAQSGLLHTAKRRDFRGNQSGVDADHPGFERFRHAPDAADVTTVEVRSKAELGVVGHRDRFLLRAEAEQRRDRAEGFLARHQGTRRHVGQNRRFEEATAQGVTLSSHHHARALAEGILDVLLDLRHGLVVDERPLRRARLESRRRLQFLDGL